MLVCVTKAHARSTVQYLSGMPGRVRDSGLRWSLITHSRFPEHLFIQQYNKKQTHILSCSLVCATKVHCDPLSHTLPGSPVEHVTAGRADRWSHITDFLDTILYSFNNTIKYYHNTTKSNFQPFRIVCDQGPCCNPLSHTLPGNPVECVTADYAIADHTQQAPRKPFSIIQNSIFSAVPGHYSLFM